MSLEYLYGTALDKVKDYLSKYETYRLRSNKELCAVAIITHEIPEIQKIEPSVMVQILKRAATLDRAWRKTMEENPSLRGKDYDDKTRLEFETQEALGYQSYGTPTR